MTPNGHWTLKDKPLKVHSSQIHSRWWWMVTHVLWSLTAVQVLILARTVFCIPQELFLFVQSLQFFCFLSFSQDLLSLSLVLLLMSLDPGHYSHTLGSSTYIVWSSTESSSGCGNILEVTLGSTYLFVYCYGNELICYHKYENQKHERSWCQLYVYHSTIIF